MATILMTKIVYYNGKILDKIDIYAFIAVCDTESRAQRKEKKRIGTCETMCCRNYSPVFLYMLRENLRCD